MLQISKIIWMGMIVALLTACHSGGRYHPSSLPDPAAYNAHFGDMDANQNDHVTREEFKAHFPGADMSVFEVVDADRDNRLSHEEWHQFKEAHSLRHQ